MVLIWGGALFCCLGLVMVCRHRRHGRGQSTLPGNQSTYFLVRHSIFLVSAWSLARWPSRFPMRSWREAAPWLFIVGVVLLVVGLIPHLGREGEWCPALVAAGRHQPPALELMNSSRRCMPPTTRCAAAIHVGSGVVSCHGRVIIGVGFLLIKGAGFWRCRHHRDRLRHPSSSTASTRLFVMLAVAYSRSGSCSSPSPVSPPAHPGFMDPWQDAFGKGLSALARADCLRPRVNGLAWVSVQCQLFYLPEAHTGFLLAVIAEGTGVRWGRDCRGAVGLLVQRAFANRVVRQSAPGVSSLDLRRALGLWMGVQSFINMAVNMGPVADRWAHPSADEFRWFGHRRQLHRALRSRRIDWRIAR